MYVCACAYVYILKLAILYSVYIHVTTHASLHVYPCMERYDIIFKPGMCQRLAY